jgi:hypothetical protein
VHKLTQGNTRTGVPAGLPIVYGSYGQCCSSCQQSTLHAGGLRAVGEVSQGEVNQSVRSYLPGYGGCGRLSINQLHMVAAVTRGCMSPSNLWCGSKIMRKSYKYAMHGLFHADMKAALTADLKCEVLPCNQWRRHRACVPRRILRNI